jgi:hypothetical protein
MRGRNLAEEHLCLRAHGVSEREIDFTRKRCIVSSPYTAAEVLRNLLGKVLMVSVQTLYKPESL